MSNLVSNLYRSTDINKTQEVSCLLYWFLLIYYRNKSMNDIVTIMLDVECDADDSQWFPSHNLCQFWHRLNSGRRKSNHRRYYHLIVTVNNHRPDEYLSGNILIVRSRCFWNSIIIYIIHMIQMRSESTNKIYQ